MQAVCVSLVSPSGTWPNTALGPWFLALRFDKVRKSGTPASDQQGFRELGVGHDREGLGADFGSRIVAPDAVTKRRFRER
jgi:hypothetical protein